MMGDKFKWNKIPTTSKGFVNYELIPSPIVRRMVADAEIIKLTEEHKARTKWDSTNFNTGRIKNLEERIKHIDRLIRGLEIVEN